MKLFCRNGHVYRTRGFRREADETHCPDCGAYLETGMQKRAMEKARARAGRLRDVSPAEDTAAARFHMIVCGDPCWGIENRDGHVCGDRLEAHHLIAKSWLERELPRTLATQRRLAIKYATPLGICVCDDLHQAIESALHPIYFDEVPFTAIEYAHQLDQLGTAPASLLSRLETECPTRPAAQSERNV